MTAGKANSSVSNRENYSKRYSPDECEQVNDVMASRDTLGDSTTLAKDKPEFRGSKDHVKPCIDDDKLDNSHHPSAVYGAVRQSAVHHH